MARPQPARAALLAGLLVFAAGQLALGWAARQSAYLRDPMYADKIALLRARLCAAESRGTGRPFTVVMIGNSHTGFGFHARLLEDRLSEAGRPAVAFNFGVPGAGPLTYLLYARRLFADGLRPDLLLVEGSPPALYDRELQSPGGGDPAVGSAEFLWLHGDRLWRDELDVLTRFDETGSATAKLRREWRESWQCPAYALRFPVLGRLAPSWVKWNLRMDYSRLTDDAGWGPPATEAVTPEQYRLGLAQARLEYGWLGCPSGCRLGGAARAFRALLAEARAAGVPAALVLMPEGHDFQHFYRPERWREAVGFLADVGREFDAPLIVARDWIPDEDFTDSHHLLRRGAALFTTRLAEELRPLVREGRP